MNHRKNTSFYVEALLLTLFFFCMTAILVCMFAAARKESILARSLTQSQQIAQNVSAAFYGTSSPQDFWQAMGTPPDETPSACLTVNANGEECANGEYILTLMLDVSSCENGLGQMAQLSLSIRHTSDETELFSDCFMRYLPQ